MASYKYSEDVSKVISNEFDEMYQPGSATPHSGIYNCKGCGQEVASNKGNPLPPQSHHQHAVTQGTIRWKLIVKAA
jgi:hypothetical protein